MEKCIICDEELGDAFVTTKDGKACMFCKGKDAGLGGNKDDDKMMKREEDPPADKDLSKQMGWGDSFISDSHWEDYLEKCEELLLHDLGKVSDTVKGIRDWIARKCHVTEKQMTAIDNIYKVHLENKNDDTTGYNPHHQY